MSIATFGTTIFGSSRLSQLSNKAIELLEAGLTQDAYRTARDAYKQAPEDGHAVFALGLCFRALGRNNDALECQERANMLVPESPGVLLALAIARQQTGDLDGAIKTLKNLFAVNPDNVLAFNTLGVTQRMMGEYEKAEANYREGAKVLAIQIAASMINSKENHVYPEASTRHNLWVEYATTGALWLSAKDSNVDLLIPLTEDVVRQVRKAGELQGLLWTDLPCGEKETGRVFLPNYYSTFFSHLTRDTAFANFMGNLSVVLDNLGKSEDADRHLFEANEIMSRLKKGANKTFKFLRQ